MMAIYFSMYYYIFDEKNILCTITNGNNLSATFDRVLSLLSKIRKEKNLLIEFFNCKQKKYAFTDRYKNQISDQPNQGPALYAVV